MGYGEAERRRGRRADVQAPTVVRHVGPKGSDARGAHSAHRQQLSNNISLAGVYFETDEENLYNINDVVMASVSIPEAKRREFPFTRLAGRSRVVRVDCLSTDAGHKRFGIALEFGEDMTALTATPLRG